MGLSRTERRRCSSPATRLPFRHSAHPTVARILGCCGRSECARFARSNARFESEFAALFDAQGEVRHDPDARRGHWTRIDSRSELAFDVIQTLIDALGEGGFQIEAEVVLEEPRMPVGPMLRILGVRG